jgi:GNAT superfamily N-acetyltransferase
MAVDAIPMDRRSLRRFVRLERELSAGRPLWWGDFDSDVVKRLRGRSALTAQSEMQAFVASEGRPRARCAAIINHRWQEDNDDLAGGIGYFAAADDAGSEVAALLARAESWLAERGCDRALAPFNGGAIHGLGVLVASFDEEPVFPMPWQPPSYSAYLEASGYRPTYPLWVYEVGFGSDAYRAAQSSALANPVAVVRPVNKRRWKDELTLIGRLVNASFKDEWESYDYADAEWIEVMAPIRHVLDPRLMVIAEVDAEPVGACFAFPQWTDLIRSMNGRLGPLQLIRFVRQASRAPRAGVISIALLPGWRGKGIGRTMLATVYRRFQELGYERGSYFYVNESNRRSRGLIESFGGEGRPLFYCYDKPLR